MLLKAKGVAKLQVHLKQIVAARGPWVVASLATETVRVTTCIYSNAHKLRFNQKTMIHAVFSLIVTEEDKDFASCMINTAGDRSV